jgi:hypothetical protein
MRKIGILMLMLLISISMSFAQSSFTIKSDGMVVYNMVDGQKIKYTEESSDVIILLDGNKLQLTIDNEYKEFDILSTHTNKDETIVRLVLKANNYKPEEELIIEKSTRNMEDAKVYYSYTSEGTLIQFRNIIIEEHKAFRRPTSKI